MAQVASKHGHVDVVRFLLKAHGDQNKARLRLDLMCLDLMCFFKGLQIPLYIQIPRVNSCGKSLSLCEPRKKPCLVGLYRG